MPGPIHFPTNDHPPANSISALLGANYAHDPNWRPGPMAPPPAHKYPDVWAKKRKAGHPNG